jgi:hypothetical protein
LERVGALDESLDFAEDVDFFQRVVAVTEVPWFPRPVVDYRLHETNHSVEHREGRFYPRRAALAAWALVSRVSD